jgi:ribosomal protein S18 acetylase RimI-like enzyme
VALVKIEAYDPSRLEAIVQLSLRAWAPVFASLERVMDADVYRVLVPDWRVSQRAAVEATCTDANVRTWLATQGERVLGFAALKLHAEDRTGEIYMIAVDPDFQRQGVASALTARSLDWFREAGMAVAMVETGGDPGHAPARAAYEASGFRQLPLARYYKKL